MGELTFDLRIQLFKIHIGIRIRPLPRTWKWGFPFGRPTTSLFLGPIEFTVFVRRYNKLINLSLSVSAAIREQHISFRLHPFRRWRWKFENEKEAWLSSASVFCGPISIYAHGPYWEDANKP